ncbi:MAG: hypothetical protein ABSF26_24845 [Thermoguttaceae bacterium]
MRPYPISCPTIATSLPNVCPAGTNQIAAQRGEVRTMMKEIVGSGRHPLGRLGLALFRACSAADCQATLPGV